MAKKEGNKVKNGFIFYLFMLILIIFAAFFICVMIMMFSPGTKILGYQYFNFNDEPVVLTTTTDATPAEIDFSKIQNVIIQSGYTNVSIVKATNKEQKDSIIIENKAKGFAKAKQYTDFEYSIKVSDNNLEIKIKEPEGFLYLSKNISIQFCVSLQNENIKTASFTINTKKGNITIGNTSPVSSQYLDLDSANLSLTSESGNIVIAKGAGKELAQPQEGEVLRSEVTFNSLYLQTSSGNISSVVNDINIIGATKVSILDKGTCNFKNNILKVSSQGLELDIDDGSFIAQKVNGNVKVYNLNSGRIEIEEITGTFDTNKSPDSLGKGQIVLGTVSKDLSIPYGGKADITIDYLKGISLISTTSGNINIVEGIMAPSTLETTSGSIKAVIDDSTIEKEYKGTYYTKVGRLPHMFTSNSGNINVEIKGSDSIRSYNEMRTKGSVDIKLSQDNHFTMTTSNFAGQPIEALNPNLTISFIQEEDYAPVMKINYQEPVKADGEDEQEFQSKLEEYKQMYVDRQLVINCGNKIKVHF